MNDFQTLFRLNRLQLVVAIIGLLLLAKVFLSILYQYRWYFPANFSSEFLSGRQDAFHGAYRAAFYAHIIGAPLALILGLFLLVSGHHSLHFRFSLSAAVHRFAGRMQAVIVLLIVVPSGLVMAFHAFAGGVAGAGLALLSIVTASCVILTIHSILDGNVEQHRSWAIRSCILLGSPLLLRLLSGVVLVMQLEPNTCYRLNAWFSWLIPLGSYELWRHCSHRVNQVSFSRSKNEQL